MKITNEIYHKTNVQISSFKSAAGIAEYHIMLSLTDTMDNFETQLKEILTAYTHFVEHLGGSPKAIFRRYFLSDVTNQTEAVMEQERLQTYCALSIVQQAPMNGTKLALWAWLQTKVETNVMNNGMFEASHHNYKQLLTANMCNKAANAEYQMRLVFRDYIFQLTEAECKLAENCLRTWIFVQNVDVNYPGIVKARNNVFLTQNLTDQTHYITSTGIEGRYFDPMVFVTMDTYAVGGLQNEQIKYLYAPSHLNRTSEYGVSFERGVAVTYGDRRHIFIAGTASIDSHGEIVHKGDVIKQAGHMIENIKKLLEEGEAGINDISQAIIYLRDSADYDRVKAFIKEELPNLPYVIVRAPVCRTGWLIQMECMAITKKGDKKFAPL